jgi:hypothetical protein
MGHTPYFWYRYLPQQVGTHACRDAKEFDPG